MVLRVENSITNYSGEARSYLSKTNHYNGRCFHKTLTRDNDYLVCGKLKEKFDALNKWVDSEGNLEIKVVNHLWLEDCYVQWHKVDSSLDKYKILVMSQWNGTMGWTCSFGPSFETMV